jgi:hypothetical protein
MHNIIEEMILSLTPEEFRELKYFLAGRENVPGERADRVLLEKIRKGETADAGNANAYHQTRKRLKKQLELYIQNNNLGYDTISRINNEIEVARFLFRKGLYKEGWYYLQKAEKAALAAEEYTLLGFVYDTQVYYALDNWPLRTPSLSIPELLDKKVENARLIRSDSDANSAYLLILFEVSELFNKKVYGDIDAIIKKVLKKYNLEDGIYDSPKVYVKVVNIVCRAFREKKDYQNLKRYSISSFQVMKKKKMLDKIPSEFLMDLLRSIYQSSTRTKDFKTAIKFQGIYNEQKERFRLQYDKYSYFDFRSQIMLADIYLFTGNLEQAQTILLVLNEKYTAETENVVIYFFLRINLLGFYFITQEYDACISIYSDLMQQYGKQVLKADGLGLEMLFFTEIYGAMMYYEKGDEEYALYLLNKIKRKYSGSVITKNNLDREKSFVQILEKIIKNKSYVQTKKFQADCERFITIKEYIPGDKEYISLNAWLQSKLTKRSYYECFLMSVKRRYIEGDK